MVLEPGDNKQKRGHARGFSFVRELLGPGMPPEVERRFLEMTPRTYTWLAPQLVDSLD
jgi:hypothetical protein